MIYTWNVVRYPDGVEPSFAPCRLFDANGREIDKPVVWVDTETGEVRSQVRIDGKTVIDHDAGEVVTHTTWHYAPLLLQHADDPDPPMVVRAGDTTTMKNAVCRTAIPNTPPQ